MSLVELHRFYSPVEAELARLRLANAGIEAFIFDVEAAYVGMAVGIRIMVHDSDEEEALGVLAEEGGIQD